MDVSEINVSQVPLFELAAAAAPEVAISPATASGKTAKPGAMKSGTIKSETKQVIVYTDGGCQPNPGPGGWGAVLIFNGMEKELYGYDADTTNNRMELTGAIRALEALKEPCRVKLHSDSALLINAFTQNWIPGWQRKGWVNASKEPVKNRDLWEQLIVLSRTHQVEWIKVKGHAGIHYNERCDQLCALAIREGKG